MSCFSTRSHPAGFKQCVTVTLKTLLWKEVISVFPTSANSFMLELCWILFWAYSKNPQDQVAHVHTRFSNWLISAPQECEYKKKRTLWHNICLTVSMSNLPEGWKDWGCGSAWHAPQLTSFLCEKYTRYMFYVCEVIGFVDWLERGLIYMWEEFTNVYLLMTRVSLSWGDCVWLTGHQNPVTTTTVFFMAPCLNNNNGYLDHLTHAGPKRLHMDT